MKYVVFEASKGDVRINRSNIVGFSVPNRLVIWTEVLLDSGTSVSLNGVYIDDAVKTLEDFDKENRIGG